MPLIPSEILSKSKNSAPAHKFEMQHLAGNWIRFFARTFDLALVHIFVICILAVFLSVYVKGFSDWLITPGADQIFTIACVPVSLLIDSLIYRLFKNTLGKAMLGLSVIADNGKKAVPSVYLHRNFALWKSGLAFSVPLFNLFTMGFQFNSLRKTGKTTYDKKLGLKVVNRKNGLLMKGIFALLFMALFIFILIVNSTLSKTHLGPVNSHDTGVNEVLQNETGKWVNPITFKSVKVSSSWSVKKELNTQGNPYFIFMNKDNQQEAILFFEKNTLQDFKTYADLTKDALSKTLYIDPSKGDYYDNKNGYDLMMTGGLKAKDDPSLSWKMILVRNNEWSWRIISFYPNVKDPLALEWFDLATDLMTTF